MPFKAGIILKKEKNNGHNKGVMILIETIDGKLTNIAQELPRRGRKLRPDDLYGRTERAVAQRSGEYPPVKHLLAPIKFICLIATAAEGLSSRCLCYR